MKLKNLHEAQYKQKPAASGWSDKQVLEAFFEVDEEWAEEMREFPGVERLRNAIPWVVKDEFEAWDGNRHHIRALYQLRNGKFLAQDPDAEREWYVFPSKFEVKETRIVYNG